MHADKRPRPGRGQGERGAQDLAGSRGLPPGSAVERMLEELHLDNAALDRRLAFVGLTESDRGRLRDLSQILRGYEAGFTQTFYDHLLAFEETARFLPDAETVSRLRASQGRYFRALLTGEYDLDYARDRLRVGLVHQRLGLSPSWYLASYAWYLRELIPEIWRRFEGDAERFIPTVIALTKVLLVDMGLAVESYVAAERRSAATLPGFTEWLFANLPLGLLVIDDGLRVRSANAKVVDWFGSSQEWLLARKLTELLAADGLDELARKAVAGAIVPGVTANLSLPGHRSGIPVRVTMAGMSFADSPGAIIVIEDRSRQVALEDQLSLSQRQFESAFEFAAIGMALVAPDGRWLKVNRSLCELTGYEEEELLRLRFQDITHPDDLEADLEYVRQMLEGRIRTYQMEKRYIRKDGRIVWILLSVSLVRDASGQPLFFISQIQDITRRKELEAEWRRLSSIVEATPDFVGIASVDGQVEYLNRGARRLLGLGDEEEPAGLRIADGHPTWATRRILNEGIPEAIRSGSWVGETALLTRDGREVPVIQAIIAHREPGGNVAFLSTIARDISDRKAYEQRIEELAFRDPLTGLPNRRLLADRLERALIGAKRHDRSVAVLLLDLDRFKLVNDSFGHESGDIVLRVTARRLEKMVRREDTVARLGGDEFVIVLGDLADPHDVEQIARKINTAIGRPFTAKEPGGAKISVALTASIGISFFPVDGEDVSALLRHADAAMYRAKAAGGNRYAFFAPELEAETRFHFDLERALRRALAKKQFRLHFQPIVEVSRRRIVGAEALLRWDRPGHGLRSPGEFLPLLERTDLINSVGEWVLQTACESARAWRDSGLPVEWVAVNVAPKQLNERAWVDQVSRALERYRLPPQALVLELTETSLVDHHAVGLETLDRLRQLGVRVALDDFGTGYSTFEQLRALPVDIVKVAPQFVQAAQSSEVDAAIAQSIIMLAHKRGLQVVGEGVETREQLAFLRRHGCDYAQGYLLGRPSPADDVPGWQF